MAGLGATERGENEGFKEAIVFLLHQSFIGIKCDEPVTEYRERLRFKLWIKMEGRSSMAPGGWRQEEAARIHRVYEISISLLDTCWFQNFVIWNL